MGTVALERRSEGDGMGEDLPGYAAGNICSEWAGIGAVERVFPGPHWTSLGTLGTVRHH